MWFREVGDGVSSRLDLRNHVSYRSQLRICILRI